MTLKDRPMVGNGGALLYRGAKVRAMLAGKDAEIATLKRELGQALGCLLAIQRGCTDYLEERSPGVTMRPAGPPEALPAADLPDGV